MAPRALRVTSKILLLCGLVGAFVAGLSAQVELSEDSAAPDVPTVYRVEITGPITPTALDQLEQALERAENANARALLVRLDTPGGLVSSMDDMIRRILSARIPVITYVYPPGATCGSAGVYLMYASHVAAMAPGTNIGSATPVQMGGGGFGGQEEEKPARPADRIPETAGADDELNMKRKLLHHAIAQMRSLAEYHGRNVEFGERSITHAENITSTEALRIRAIDAIAESEAALLEQVQGKSVRLLTGRVNLNTAGARIEPIESDFRTRALSVIAHPQVAMILMMIGMLGILAEVFYAPGSIFPGALGAVCLVLGLYALQTLPVNYAGFALIALGVLFFILEIKIISYGLLSIAGIVSLTLGSLMLLRSGEEFLGMGASVIVTISVFSGLAMAAIAYLAARSQRGRPVSGAEGLAAETGVAQTEITADSGRVFIHSEIWQARSAGGNIPIGAEVRVVERRGLLLIVAPR